AEDLLRKWREHPSERQELSALLEELTTLGRGAEMAELPQIDELCEALLDLYGAVEEGSLAVSERFFDEAEKAHEALIGMMDQVAAALQVSPQSERVQALRDLLGEAIDPNTLALLTPGAEGLDIVELDQATAELEQADAGPQVQDQLAEVAVVEDAGQEPQAEAYAEAGPDSVEADLDEEMVEIFLEEAVDILESAGQALDRWLGEPDNTLPLSSLQRDLHTLKGGARMAAIRPIGDLGHELESLYEGLVDRRYSYSSALGSLLQQSHDRLAQMLDQLQARQRLVSGEDLIQAIRAFRQGGTAQSLSAAVDQVEPEAAAESVESVEPEAGSFELPPLALVEDEIVREEALPAEPEPEQP